MRILYIGAREMGYECLKLLIKNYEQQIVAVYTISDALIPKTAGHKSFDGLISGKSIHFFKVDNINDQKVIEQIKNYEPDLIIQVAWSQIIKDEILKIPKLGCVGFHSSLLPSYRGGSPVNWGLINGEKEWGITFFYIAPGVDAGDIISQKKFEITLEDTCKTVYEKCTECAVQILNEFIPKIENGTAPRIKQNLKEGTHVKRRKPEHGLIDWNKTSLQLYNWVRALTHPYPGAFTFYNNKKIFVWKAKIGKWKGNENMGTIVDKNFGEVLVKTSDGVLILQLIEEEGKKEAETKKYNLKIGEQFANA